MKRPKRHRRLWKSQRSSTGVGGRGLDEKLLPQSPRDEVSMTEDLETSTLGPKTKRL